MSARTWLVRVLGLQPSPQVGLSFAMRATCAAVLALVLCGLLGMTNPVWAVVSAVVVIMPDVRASVSSAALRVLANMIGAGAGFAVSLLDIAPIPSLVVALPTAVLVCRLVGIDVAARTACVAVVIVLLKDPADVGASSHVRVALVALGCAVALAVTVVAAAIERAVLGRPPGQPTRT